MKRPRAFRSSRCGIVLIVVLVIITMISLAGFGFLSAMSTEYEATRLHGSLRQAHQTLASAESMALWFVGLPSKYRLAMGGTHHNPAQFQSQLVLPLTATPGASGGSFAAPLQPVIPNLPVPPSGESPGGAIVSDDRWRFSLVAMDHSPQRPSVLRFGLTNESGKLSLARLLQWDQANPGTGRQALLNIPGVTEAIADCLLDWIDADDVPRESGAESEYYLTLDLPYRAANTLPGSLSELLFVRGVSRELLAGQLSDAAVGASGDGFGTFASATDPSGSSAVPWEHFLTLHSAERNQSAEGKPRVSLNLGTLAELEEKLAPLLSEDLVRYILLARAYGLNTDAAPGALRPEPGSQGERRSVREPAGSFGSGTVQPAIGSGVPAAFSIHSLADLFDSSINVPTASGNMVVVSPLTAVAPDFADQLNRLHDLVSTDAALVINGRININLASELVLKMIPGITAEQASQIVAMRDSLEESERSSLAWLITRNVLDVSAFRRIFPEITTGGDVYRTEIVVHRPVGGPMLRRNLIVDAASAPARRVYWSDETDSPLSYPLRLLSYLPSEGN